LFGYPVISIDFAGYFYFDNSIDVKKNQCLFQYHDIFDVWKNKLVLSPEISMFNLKLLKA